MSGYSILLAAHSDWRWAVLASGIWALWRSGSGLRKAREWSAKDDRASRLFVAAVDIQLLLGVILYLGFSPYFSLVYHSFRAAMKHQQMRFFGIEHETAMLLAIIAVHIGRDRVRAQAAAMARYRALFVSAMVFFALVAWAIPWPFRAVGRPLLRGLS